MKAKNKSREKFFTVREAAIYLGYRNYKSLYNLLYQKRGPDHYKTPTGRILFTKKQLDKWVMEKGREICQEKE